MATARDLAAQLAMSAGFRALAASSPAPAVPPVGQGGRPVPLGVDERIAAGLRFRPPIARHYPNSLGPPKAAGNSVLTIARSEVLADLAEINAGRAARSGETFRVSSRRLYGFDDDIVFPMSGPGVVELKSYQYNLPKEMLMDPASGNAQLQAQLAKGLITQADVDLIRQLAASVGK